MKNTLICKNCKSENQFYQMNCSNCGTILRGRVVNIDLWQMVWKLVESPKQGFETIIHAEHKNFISFILILAGIKAFILSSFIFNLVKPSATSEMSMLSQSLISIVFVMCVLLFFAGIISITGKIFQARYRFMDNLAIYVYSFVPLVVSLVIFFPVQYGIFGGHWIYFNPSPFMIKSSSAYLLAGIDGLFLIWHVFLLVLALYVQSKNFGYSLALALVIDAVIIIGAGIVPPWIITL